LCPINRAVTLAASGLLAFTSATFSFTFSSSSSRVAATASIDFIAAACLEAYSANSSPASFKVILSLLYMIGWLSWYFS